MYIRFGGHWFICSCTLILLRGGESLVSLLYNTGMWPYRGINNLKMYHIWIQFWKKIEMKECFMYDTKSE